MLATGHYLCDQPEEAAAAARQAIEQSPGNLSAHVMLIAALAAQRRNREAEAALEQLRRVKKDPSLDDFAASQPYRDSTVLGDLLEELRAVGLT